MKQIIPAAASEGFLPLWPAAGIFHIQSLCSELLILLQSLCSELLILLSNAYR